MQPENITTAINPASIKALTQAADFVVPGLKIFHLHTFTLFAVLTTELNPLLTEEQTVYQTPKLVRLLSSRPFLGDLGMQAARPTTPDLALAKHLTHKVSTGTESCRLAGAFENNNASRIASRLDTHKGK